MSLKRIHLKSAAVALCSGLCVSALTSEALAVKATPKPAKKVVKSPVTPAPGRTKVAPAPLDGTMPAAFAIKMRPSNSGKSKLATSLPAKKSLAPTRTLASNEPVANFGRTIRIGWNSPTPSLGSTFAMAVDGEYVITTADAVTDAWTNSGDVKFFLPDSAQPLSLATLDLQTNIAVFSVGVTARLEKSLNRQRLRFEPSEPNENFSVLTTSGLSMTAKRVSEVKDFGGSRERFELSNSEIRSTAFVFDRYNRWVATLSPNDRVEGRTFTATPSPAVQDLLRIIEMKPPAVVNRSALQALSTAWQDKWTASYLTAAQQGNALRALTCAAEPMKIEDTKFASQVNRTRLVRCQNNLPITVERDYAMGVELVTGDVTLNEDVKAMVSNDSQEMGSFAKALFGQKREPASVNLLTVPECEKTDVTNSRSRKVHVQFCTSALKNAQGLSDTTITVISADTGSKAQVSSMHLKGFDVKNSKRFMEWMINAEAIR